MPCKPLTRFWTLRFHPPLHFFNARSVVAFMAIAAAIILVWQRYRRWVLHLEPGLNRCASGR